ncbi:TPA: hypothetical protein RI785_002378 [Vibrio cholerae]|nr:hypothetical protein [Vibrio cholerae]
MAILGFSYNISDKLNPEQATLFAQWIGAANVIRNQKIRMRLPKAKLVKVS